jgi:hypothetical protein
MTMTLRLWWTLAFVLAFAGCTEEGKEPAKKGIAAQDLFLEYQVWGDEARGQVNVLLQLRQKNGKGKTVRLDAPGFVKLDDEVLQADSSRMTGVFYETQKPLEAFAGHHRITVGDGKGKQASEEFEYTPFTLSNHLDGRVGRDALVLKLAGLKNGDQVRVTLVDTVFRTQDINELMPVVGGRLHITREQLKEVKGGPVTLLLFKEEDRPIDNSAVRGGKMAVTYGLMREFELAE